MNYEVKIGFQDLYEMKQNLENAYQTIDKLQDLTLDHWVFAQNLVQWLTKNYWQFCPSNDGPPFYQNTKTDQTLSVEDIFQLYTNL